jgi:hypothetical protein
MLFLAKIAPSEVAGFAFATPILRDVWSMTEEA